MLMLMHTEGVVKGRITLERWWTRVHGHGPDVGLANKGAIAAGKDADIVVFDPKKKFTITQKKLHQNVDYTPWEGLEMTGMPQIVVFPRQAGGGVVRRPDEIRRRGGRSVREKAAVSSQDARARATIGVCQGDQTERNEYRGTAETGSQHVIYSWKAQGGWKPTVIDHAEGIYMYDTDGRRSSTAAPVF